MMSRGSDEELVAILKYLNKWSAVGTEFQFHSDDELDDDQKPKMGTRVVEAINIIKLTCKAILSVFDTSGPATPEGFQAYKDVFKSSHRESGTPVAKFFVRLRRRMRMSETFRQAEQSFIRSAEIELELASQIDAIEQMDFVAATEFTQSGTMLKMITGWRPEVLERPCRMLLKNFQEQVSIALTTGPEKATMAAAEQSKRLTFVVSACEVMSNFG